MAALKFKSSTLRISCPGVVDGCSIRGYKCDGTISYDSLSDVGVRDELLHSMIEKSKSSFEFLKEDVIESLSIRCPRKSCSVLLDLNPDACSAVTCVNCGQNFCGCCHACFLSGNEVHLHIPLAHNWQDVFLPREKLLEGNRRIVMTQLRVCLDKIYSTDLIIDLLRNMQAELQQRQLPIEWTEITQESDASRSVLERERLGNFVGHTVEEDNPPLFPAAANDVVNRPVGTEQERRGQEVLMLCFQGRFDEVRVKLFEFHRNELDFVIDWMTKDVVSDMYTTYHLQLRLLTPYLLVSKSGNTAFSCAARVNNLHLRLASMELLVSAGAQISINEPDCDGFTALQRFILLNDIVSVKFMLGQPNVDIEKPAFGMRTPLFLCAEKAYVHIARELLRRGAYLHTSDADGITVLLACAINRTVADSPTTGDTIRNLVFWLQAGADVEVPDGQCHWRPLHYAACGRYGVGAAAVKLLLRYGANALSKNHFDQTPLDIAVCHGNMEAIAVLVEEEGLYPSIPLDRTDDSILIAASVESRRTDIIRTLRNAQRWVTFKYDCFHRMGELYSSTKRYHLPGVIFFGAVCVGVFVRNRLLWK